MSNRLTALSLFSGIGGFCEGFNLAGFKVTGAVEHDRYAAANYRLNFPTTPLFADDIQKFLARGPQQKHMLQEFTSDGTVDVVFGGPPCQGYSQIGPREISDPRNSLYREFCRVLDVVKPRAAVIENVPNMFLLNKGHFKQLIFQELQRSGYSNIGWVKLSASSYGVPQDRHRIFILALRDGLLETSAQTILDETAQSLTKNLVSVGDAISDLPKLVAADSGCTLEYAEKPIVTAYQKEMRLDHSGDFYSQESKLERYRLHDELTALHNHHTKEIQAERLALIKLLKPGAKANSLPKEVWNNARPEKWRRFDPNKPAHTLLAQMHRDLSEWIHPKHHRWITVREAMRLQSFHDGFVLGTSEWQQLKQVGNAVPPMLGYVPAMAARLAIAKSENKRPPFKVRGQGNLFA